MTISQSVSLIVGLALEASKENVKHGFQIFNLVIGLSTAWWMRTFQRFDSLNSVTFIEGKKNPNLNMSYLTEAKKMIF